MLSIADAEFDQMDRHVCRKLDGEGGSVKRAISGINLEIALKAGAAAVAAIRTAPSRWSPRQYRRRAYAQGRARGSPACRDEMASATTVDLASMRFLHLHGRLQHTDMRLHAAKDRVPARLCGATLRRILSAGLAKPGELQFLNDWRCAGAQAHALSQCRPEPLRILFRDHSRRRQLAGRLPEQAAQAFHSTAAIGDRWRQAAPAYRRPIVEIMASSSNMRKPSRTRGFDGISCSIAGGPRLTKASFCLYSAPYMRRSPREPRAAVLLVRSALLFSRHHGFS